MQQNFQNKTKILISTLIVEQFDAVHSKLFSLQNRSGPARMDNSAIVTFDGLPKGIYEDNILYSETISKHQLEKKLDYFSIRKDV